MTTPSVVGEIRRGKKARRLERAARRREKANGVLGPRMRNRTLQTTLKMETDFLDLADRKARFALIIMSVLNASALVLVTKSSDELVPREGPWGAAIQIELVIYAAVTAYYIWQAIETLRPRGKLGRPTAPIADAVVPGESARVLFHSDIVTRSRDEYRRLWDDIRLDNVNAELADQLHMVSCINAKKFDALARLYYGVGVMTALLTIILLTMGAHRVL